ncbi:hypothetical protein [Fictibacillus phosphorivorans]
MIILKEKLNKVSFDFDIEKCPDKLQFLGAELDFRGYLIGYVGVF